MGLPSRLERTWSGPVRDPAEEPIQKGVGHGEDAVNDQRQNAQQLSQPLLDKVGGGAGIVHLLGARLDLAHWLVSSRRRSMRREVVKKAPIGSSSDTAAVRPRPSDAAPADPTPPLNFEPPGGLGGVAG